MIDGEKSGRPKVINKAKEAEILANVCKNRSGREKSSEVLAYKASISINSALRILYKYNLSNVKLTRKPSLNTNQKAARLDFALAHEH